MINKWFFFADISKVGLILIATTAASFDQYYISENAESNNITLYSLNVKLFTNRNFKNISTIRTRHSKIGQNKNSECHCEYKFYFKAGGCIPPMEKITDPSKQPTFPIPNNLANPNSLQSTDEPIESFLYQFDERRGEITATAADRITKDYGLKKSIFSDSTTIGADLPPVQTPQEEMYSSEEEETKKETLFNQLLHQRNKQKQLRQRINQLLIQLQQQNM